VDHRDRNPLNDSILNLRWANYQMQNKNRKISPRGTFGRSIVVTSINGVPTKKQFPNAHYFSIFLWKKKYKHLSSEKELHTIQMMVNIVANKNSSRSHSLYGFRFKYSECYTKTKTGEIWKVIPSLEGCEASSFGRIRDNFGYIRTPRISPAGYCKTSLKNKDFFTHRLVALTFLPKSSKPIVHHLNHIKTDNRIENLKFCTRQEHGIEHRSEKNMFEVERVLDKKQRGRGYVYLIKWKGFNASFNSWEPRSSLLIDIPDMIKTFDERN